MRGSTDPSVTRQSLTIWQHTTACYTTDIIIVVFRNPLRSYWSSFQPNQHGAKPQNLAKSHDRCNIVIIIIKLVSTPGLVVQQICMHKDHYDNDDDDDWKQCVKDTVPCGGVSYQLSPWLAEKVIFQTLEYFIRALLAQTRKIFVSFLTLHCTVQRLRKSAFNIFCIWFRFCIVIVCGIFFICSIFLYAVLP